MNFRHAATVAALCTALSLSSSASAQTFLTATLTNAAEGNIFPTFQNGAPRSSFGTASFVLNSTMTAMTFSAIINGLDFTGSQSADINDNLTNAHIHAGPGIPNPNFPVVWGFIGSPLNDLNPNDVVVTPFLNGVGGTVSGKWDLTEGQNTTLALQLDNILNGRAYINFHSVQFGGGEVRGALVVVPEPSSLVLLTAGLAAMGLAIRSRKTR